MQHKHLIPLGFALVSALAGAQAPLSPEDVFERASPSVWVVRTLDGAGRPLLQGSAVVIGSGRLITNCHVLRQARTVSVARENVSYGATLEHPDTERDLCQLRVSNFTAPAVDIAPLDSLRVGARVYAIGAPRGLENTLSDGLLAGLRRGERSDLEALQITVPISPGSSGGGLFDARGRLIGITSSGLRESQNLNFALPATWIAEVPTRAQEALVARSIPAIAAASDGTVTKATGGDRVFEYRLRDRLSGAAQPVVYRLDRADGDKLVFNQGGRVELPGGGVVSITQPIGGEFDQMMPPGGWVNEKPELGKAWTLKYTTRQEARTITMELRAIAMEESVIAVGQRQLPTVRVQFRGHTHRGQGGFYVAGTYLANAWYSPELGRVVRFDVKTRSNSSTGLSFHIDELLELVDIRSE